MDPAAFRDSFSQPIGPGGAYAPPPYLYRGVQDIFIAYEADPAGVEALLPPGLEAADEMPVCIAWGRWIPFSSFGPYHEAYVMIRATLRGTDLPLPAVHLHRQRDPARRRPRDLGLREEARRR